MNGDTNYEMNGSFSEEKVDYNSIGFLGVGNMGGAILKGYAASLAKTKSEGEEGEKTQKTLYAYRRDEEKLKEICRETGAIPCSSPEELVQKSDILVVGVKPNTFPDVMPAISALFSPEKILVSMAAGVTIRDIARGLGGDAKIIRVMPNTPAMVGEGMTSLSRNENVDNREFMEVVSIFTAIGKAAEVEESHIHSVIGASGSGPAYAYMFMDALIEAAVENGMGEDEARYFVAQMVRGAAEMVLQSKETPDQLKTNVCSPGGTTIEAVHVLEKEGFKETVKHAYQAAVDRSKEMAK